MSRLIRTFTVVVAGGLAIWGGWWWVQHTYVRPAERPVALAAGQAAASPQICVEPNGTIVNNCAEKLAEGKFVLVAPAGTVTVPQQVVVQQPVQMQQEEVVEQPAPAEAQNFDAPGPCVTPAGDIYAPDCAAPPNSSAVGGGPSGGGGGGGGADAPAPCATPEGAIYSSC